MITEKGFKIMDNYTGKIYPFTEHNILNMRFDIHSIVYVEYKDKNARKK